MISRPFDHLAHRILSVPLRVYLGGVFLAACWYKIQEPAVFALSVATYQILPLSLINLMAIALPWIELVVGLSLVIGFKSRACALCCAGMLCTFIIAISSALYFDLRLSCGCFASADAAEEMSVMTIWRDVIWLLISVYLLLTDSGHFGIDGLLARKRAKE